jgi:hypothetical protein
MLATVAGGYGALAAESLWANGYNLRAKQPHFPAKAKRVIFLYIGGGASTIDMYDPKPTLVKYDAKPAPFQIKGRALNGSQQVMASPWEFQRHGQSGRPVSSLLPKFTQVVDKVAFVRSMATDRIDHSTAQFTFVTGRGFSGFPAIGSWVAYALGTENQNLPAYVAIESSRATIGTRAFSSSWLPPLFSGTVMEPKPESPIPDIRRPEGVSAEEQRKLLDLVSGLNQKQIREYPFDAEFEARIANYELAARMQLEAMQVADFGQESKETLALYGCDDKVAGQFGKSCLLARRLVESGVRFVQVITSSGGGNGWDTHSNIKGALPGLCHSIDAGMTGLLIDLERRGMLDDTLVVWSSEFGRLPTIESNGPRPGRDHNPYGFSMWMAGAGVKAGVDYGDTDELGYAALPEFKVGHSDVHATVQHLLGIDWQRNTYPYEGRQESLIGVNPARVLKEVLA